jgi:hypothetical protein
MVLGVEKSEECELAKETKVPGENLPFFKYEFCVLSDFTA